MCDERNMTGVAESVGEGGPFGSRRAPFSAMLLAGGQSRRMGRDKARLEVEGTPLIVRQLALIRELAPEEVFIAARTTGDHAHLGVPVLADAFPGQGPLAGIERALAVARNPLVLVLAVDTPHMTAALLGRLLPEGAGSLGVVPRINGRIEPLAACYPRSAHSLAAERLDAGQNRVGDFALACVERGLVRFLDLAEGDAPRFANWNTPADISPSA